MSWNGAGVAEMMFGHLRLLEDAIYIYTVYDLFIHVATSIIYIYMYTVHVYTCVLLDIATSMNHTL